MFAKACSSATSCGHTRPEWGETGRCQSGRGRVGDRGPAARDLTKARGGEGSAGHLGTAKLISDAPTGQRLERGGPPATSWQGAATPTSLLGTHSPHVVPRPSHRHRPSMRSRLNRRTRLTRRPRHANRLPDPATTTRSRLGTPPGRSPRKAGTIDRLRAFAAPLPSGRRCDEPSRKAPTSIDANSASGPALDYDRTAPVTQPLRDCGRLVMRACVPRRIIRPCRDPRPPHASWGGSSYARRPRR